MKPRLRSALLASLFLPLAAFALPQGDREPSQAPRGALRPVAPLGGVDSEAWRKALSVEDLDRREREFDRLIQEAQANDQLRALLESWSRQHDALGWTARLALRELELRQRLGGRSRGLGGLFDDPWDDFGFGALRRGPLADPRFFDDFRKELEDLFQGARKLPNASQEEQSLRFESTPDGVKVEIHEKRPDGSEDVKTYEAESLDELLKANPELRDKLPTVRGFRLPGIDLDRELNQLFDRFGLDRFGRRGLGHPHHGPVSTDRLGILMREPGHWSASVEGLDPGVGLFVEHVFPGTLAEALGIRPGDIVVSLNGRELRSGADVAAVLSERKPEDSVTAEVVDRTGQRRKLTWSPSKGRGEPI